MTQTTLTPQVQLPHNPNKELYNRLIQERNLEAIQDLGYDDGFNGFVPIDPEFGFYYSQWCKGFMNFILIKKHEERECDRQPTPFDLEPPTITRQPTSFAPEPLTIPEINEFDSNSIDFDNIVSSLNNSDDSFIDYEEERFYPPSSSNLPPIPLSTPQIRKSQKQSQKTDTSNNNDPVILSVRQSDIKDIVIGFVADLTYGETDIDPDYDSAYSLFANALESYLGKFWNEEVYSLYLDSRHISECFPLTYQASQKEKELSIPLPHTIR